MTQGPRSLPSAGRSHRQRGVSLIEILVSLLLMSFGLLAMGAMQAWSVAGARSSGHRIVAALVAAEAADMLRANPAVLGDGSGPQPADDAAGVKCAFPACTPGALAQEELAALRSRVRMELPQGRLEISQVPSGGAPAAAQAELWVMWLEPRLYIHDGEGPANSAEQAFDNCPPSAKDLGQMPRCFYMRVAL